MKVLDKKKLELLIALCRLYWTTGTGDKEDLEDILGMMSKVRKKHFPEHKDLVCFINSIVGSLGLNPGVGDEEIYCVLKILGYEVA